MARAALVAVSIGAMLGAVRLLKAEEKRPPHLIQVMTAPAGRLYAPDPIHLSVKNNDQVRWVGGLPIFRVDGFPIQPDGSRLSIPPFVKMSFKKEPKPRWFPECQESYCDSHEINPELAESLKKSPTGHLEYVYRINSNAQTVEARLVIEP